jgi:hypothetical protein
LSKMFGHVFRNISNVVTNGGCLYSNKLLVICYSTPVKAVSLCPVLKHGPRSLIYMQVQEWKTQVRNENNC